MPANRLTRPAAKQQLFTGTVSGDSPEAVSRSIAEVAKAHEELSIKITPRSVVNVDLEIGVNRIPHGLGRAAQGANVTPTVADASFAWAFAADGDKFALITVIGAAQPRAAVELF